MLVKEQGGIQSLTVGLRMPFCRIARAGETDRSDTRIQCDAHANFQGGSYDAEHNPKHNPRDDPKYDH